VWCLHYAAHCAAWYILQYATSFEVASSLPHDKGNGSGGMGISGEGKMLGGGVGEMWIRGRCVVRAI
jgi:hypothetical protein